MTEHFDAATTEDRTLPVIVYVLYFLGLTHGLTMIIGLIIAYVSRDAAGPKMASHYTWLIRTFWVCLGLFVCGLALYAVGQVAVMTHSGWPIGLMLAIVFLAAGWLLFLERVIVGGVYVLRGEGHPRPYATL